MTAALAALLTASAVAAAPAQAGPSLSQPLNGTGFGRACVYPAPGTSITPDKSTQVLVAKATSTSRGTWARYQWGGLRVEERRHLQLGVVRQERFTGRREAFGWRRHHPTRGIPDEGDLRSGGEPGFELPYHRLDSCSVWSGADLDYNRYRYQCGFDRGLHWPELPRRDRADDFVDGPKTAPDHRHLLT